jgi:hypothetical protein
MLLLISEKPGLRPTTAVGMALLIPTKKCTMFSVSVQSVAVHDVGVYDVSLLSVGVHSGDMHCVDVHGEGIKEFA